MVQSSRRTLATFVLTAFLVVALAPMAFAPHVARIEIEPGVASPGDEISVFGPVGYGAVNPVEIHWNEPDGELLETVETDGGPFYAAFGPVDVTVPDDAASGENYLVATQELADGEGHIRGLPAYAPVQVTGGGEPADEEPAAATADSGVQRTGSLVEAEPPSVALLAVIGVATFAIALAVAALLAKTLRRGGQTAKTDTVTS